MISRYLHEHMTDSDTLAVLGSEPEIPFYSRRHSATGYIYTYGLMEVKPSAEGVKPQPLAETMQREMIAEIEEKKPKYIMVVDCRCSWLNNPWSCPILHLWANRYLRDNYEVVGLIERPPEPSQPISYRWSESRASETPAVSRWLKDAWGQPVLPWFGKFDGIQPNPFAADCTVWVCRQK